MIIKLRAPVKIFGGLYGQINTLQKYFSNWKSPDG